MRARNSGKKNVDIPRMRSKQVNTRAPLNQLYIYIRRIWELTFEAHGSIPIKVIHPARNPAPNQTIEQKPKTKQNPKGEGRRATLSSAAQRREGNQGCPRRARSGGQFDS